MPAVIAFVLDFVRDAAPPFVQVARQSIKSLTCAVVFARSVIPSTRTVPIQLGYVSASPISQRISFDCSSH
jgi:hypothetical protein